MTNRLLEDMRARLLPRLLPAYEKGRLVPFIGAGMSRRTCPDWEGLIAALETRASDLGLIDPHRGPLGGLSPEELVRRAHRVVRSLRHNRDESFGDEIRKALGPVGTSLPPAQTTTLAAIWWPLVLSTNYDNCFLSAFRSRYTSTADSRLIEVLGRSQADCQRVLNSLTSSSRSLLWALQGFVNGPCAVTGPPGEGVDLAGELVIGHEEYRRVTHHDVYFRRAFSEVFRSRSMLFLGSGLRDRYLLDLFGEIIEMFGPSNRPHYALLLKDEIPRAELRFIAERYQIEVFEYEDHQDLESFLADLRAALRDRAGRTVRWSYSLDAPTVLGTTEDLHLEVVRGTLPLPSADRECLAVSAGGDLGFHLSNPIQSLLRDAGIENPLAPNDEAAGEYVTRYGEHPVYAVRARVEGQRDLRVLRHASVELFDRARRDGFRRVAMQLLASGSRRIFPERFSFIQTVRAYAEWHKRTPQTRPFRLSLYVVTPAIYMEIASGRLDVVELLSRQDIRFWALVIHPSGDVERRLFEETPETVIDEIYIRLGLSRQHWRHKVVPEPGVEVDSRSLDDLGVVPGSAIYFRRDAE